MKELARCAILSFLPARNDKYFSPRAFTVLLSISMPGTSQDPPIPRPRPRLTRSCYWVLTIQQACWIENRLFLMDKNVFSAEYLNWVCDLTAMVPPPKMQPDHPCDSASGGATGAGGVHGHEDDVDEVELSAAKVALFLALDTVARARDKERLSQLMQYARSWFRASPAVCRWALEQVGRTGLCEHVW